MINSVRNTVLSVLNKNNYGYISPSDFNLYAKQAQLEIFQDYFRAFNKQVNLENIRQSGTDYANLAKKIAENIEVFSTTNFLSVSSNNIYSLPSLPTTGDIAYTIGKILTYTQQLATGENTSLAPSKLVNSAGAFTTLGILANDIVINTTNGTVARVVSVQNDTEILLTANIFTATPRDYLIISARSAKEAEKLSHNKVTMLTTSLLTTPNNIFPAYTSEATSVTLFPSTINTKGMVVAQYYRYPADPKWTYVSLVGGAPSFDQSQPDYQDFELPIDEETELVIKICQYCGISIREAQVYQFAKSEQQENDQPK